MKRLVLLVIGTFFLSLPAFAGLKEAIPEKIGVGTYLQSSESEQISPAGISVRCWGASSGMQVIYNKVQNEDYYTNWDSSSGNSNQTSNQTTTILRIRYLRKINTFFTGIGWMKERKEVEYNRSYCSNSGLGSLGGGEVYNNSGLGSIERGKIECLFGTEYFLNNKHISFSGETGFQYTYAQKTQTANTWISFCTPKDRVFAEVGVHLYF